MSNSTFKIPHAGDINTPGGLESVFGPSLIGGLLSMVLWGLTSSQTYDYLMDNTDNLLQRSIVIFLWILDTLGSVMDSWLVYRSLVTNYANPVGAFSTTDWSTKYRALVPGVSNFIIRTMYARRVYHLGRKNVVLVTWIMATSMGELVIFIITTVVALRRQVTDGLQLITRLIYLTFGFGVTADLSLTIALCWLLHSAKSGFRRSDSIVNLLIMYIVNTGLLVTLDATLVLITYVAVKNNLSYYALMMLVHKLYVNAYLASLNARGRVRQRDSSSTMPLSRLDLSQSMGRSTQQGGGSDRKISFQTPVERGVGDEKVKIHPVELGSERHS